MDDYKTLLVDSDDLGHLLVVLGLAAPLIDSYRESTTGHGAAYWYRMSVANRDMITRLTLMFLDLWPNMAENPDTMRTFPDEGGNA